MTVLEHELTRLIRIPGIDVPVVVTISPDGISFRAQGTRRTIHASWSKTVDGCSTGAQVPSYLFGKPYELLQSAAKKAE